MRLPSTATLLIAAVGFLFFRCPSPNPTNATGGQGNNTNPPDRGETPPLDEVPSLADYQVGTFYMPFWGFESRSKGSAGDAPGHWSVIDDFNKVSSRRERRHPIAYQEGRPYYNEDDPEVTSKQLKIMSDHGIDYVVFDSFWQYCNSCNTKPAYDPAKWRPFWDHVMDNIFPKTNRGMGYPGRDSYPTTVDFHGLKFAIKWSNDFTTLIADKIEDTQDSGNPKGCRGFFQPGGGLDRMIEYWKPYLQHPNHLETADGKPYFYIGHADIAQATYHGYKETFTNTVNGLCAMCADDPFFDELGKARKEGDTHSQKVGVMLRYIEKKMDLGPLYFVAVLGAPEKQFVDNDTTRTAEQIKKDWLIDYPAKAGYDAVSSYTYKIFDGDDFYGNYSPGDNPCYPGDIGNWEGYDYEKMAEVYSNYWNFYATESDGSVKFHVPATAGWDRSPLNLRELEQGKYDTIPKKPCPENNYKYAIWDQALSTPRTFERHIGQAKDFINRNQDLTEGNVLVCCWNEFAEGTVIEPTLEHDFGYVEAIKKTFGPKTPIEKPREAL